MGDCISGSPTANPKSYAVVALIMIGGAVAAALVAALRVRRASPMQALRAE